MVFLLLSESVLILMLSFSQHDYATMGASGGVATIEPVRQFGLFLKPFANGSLFLGVVSSYLGCRMHVIETGVEEGCK